MLPANSDLRILAPSGQPSGCLALLAQSTHGRTQPFAQFRIEALERVSKTILSNKTIGRDPAAVALAFWLRTSHSFALRDEYLKHQGADEVLVPAGLVFHIAPSNVDTLFVYSWALSFLSGNANIVRLSRKESGLVSCLLEILDMDMKAHPEAWLGNHFVSYGHDDAISAHFSELCDQRIVWGGDETVQMLRAIPLNPHASERAFASKHSIAVIKTGAVARTDQAGLDNLTKDLASDIVLFDQKACSSPHLILWLGEDADLSRKQAEALMLALATRLGAAPGAEDSGMAMHRIEAAFRLAADGKLANSHFLTGLSYAEATETTRLQDLEIGARFITQRYVSSIDEIPSMLGRSSQTISHYGLIKTELNELAWKAGLAGADRVVPVGHALDFDTIWDGFDLLGDFTRKIRCRSAEPRTDALVQENSVL